MAQWVKKSEKVCKLKRKLGNKNGKSKTTVKYTYHWLHFFPQFLAHYVWGDIHTQCVYPLMQIYGENVFFRKVCLPSPSSMILRGWIPSEIAAVKK